MQALQVIRGDVRLILANVCLAIRRIVDRGTVRGVLQVDEVVVVRTYVFQRNDVVSFLNVDDGIFGIVGARLLVCVVYLGRANMSGSAFLEVPDVPAVAVVSGALLA